MSLPNFDLAQTKNYPFSAYNASPDKIAETKIAWNKLSEMTVNNRKATDIEYMKAEKEFEACEAELLERISLEKQLPTIYKACPKLEGIVIITGPSRAELEKKYHELRDLKDKACDVFNAAAELARWSLLQKDICEAFCEFKDQVPCDKLDEATLLSHEQEPYRWTIRKMEQRIAFWKAGISN